MKFQEKCWFFYDIGNFAEVKEGQKVKIQIMRVGQWQHQEYGDVIVTPQTLIDVKRNFDDNVRKIDIAIDENHDPDHKALGWIRSLDIKDNDSLWAEIEITALGSRLLSDGAYKYFSPELSFDYKDGELGGQSTKNVLVGGAFTNRPYFKAMSPLLLKASEKEDYIFMFKNEEKKTMNKLMALLVKNANKQMSEDDKVLVKKMFDELPEEDKTEEVKSAVDNAIENDGGADDEAKKAEEEKAKAEAEAKAKEEEEAKAKDIQATEKKITISATEYNELKDVHKTISKLMTESRTLKASEKTKSMVYSESNKEGMISAKQADSITNFASSLSEAQESKFWEIMSSLKSFNFSEKGHGNDGKNEDEKFAEEQVNWLIEKNLAANEEEAKEILKVANFSEKK